MSWRSEAEFRVTVLVNDNPAYPDEVESAVREAASLAAEGDARVSTVLVNNRRGLGWTDKFLERVASAGRGQLVRDAGGSITVSLLLSLLYAQRECPGYRASRRTWSGAIASAASVWMIPVCRGATPISCV